MRRHVIIAVLCFFFFFQAEDGIRDLTVTGVQTCALPICPGGAAVPEDRAEAGGAYHARTGAQGQLRRPALGPGAAGHAAAAGPGTARLVRGARRGGVRREQPGRRIGRLRRDVVVLRTWITVTAGALAALALTACGGPVQMGSAAGGGDEGGSPPPPTHEGNTPPGGHPASPRGGPPQVPEAAD